MSILKTMGFCVLGLTAVTAAKAAEDPLRTFASCAGRLSATMEHQWLMGDPGSDRTKAQREAMISLVDSVMAPGQGREVLHWRIEAKAAHSVLLTRATFNDDPADAAWALTRAQTQLGACTGLLLS